jgi:anti-sigma B factor antagonist
MERSAPQHRPVSTGPAASPDALQLSVAIPRPGVRALLVGGELDMLTAPLLAEEIGSQLAVGPRAVIIDLTAVSFLGSSGLFVLVQAKEAASRDGVSLSIVADSQAVLRPLEITGMVRLIEIFDSFPEALSRAH